jgi:hypothetical protein
MSLAEVYGGVDVSKGRDNLESQKAWHRAIHSAENDREKIIFVLKYLAYMGWDKGLTPKEFSRYIGKPLHAISGRFGDLAALGRIQRTAYVREGSRAWELAHPDVML